jgi:hypothetical protein
VVCRRKLVALSRIPAAAPAPAAAQVPAAAPVQARALAAAAAPAAPVSAAVPVPATVPVPAATPDVKSDAGDEDTFAADSGWRVRNRRTAFEHDVTSDTKRFFRNVHGGGPTTALEDVQVVIFLHEMLCVHPRATRAEDVFRSVSLAPGPPLAPRGERRCGVACYVTKTVPAPLRLRSRVTKVVFFRCESISMLFYEIFFE